MKTTTASRPRTGGWIRATLLVILIGIVLLPIALVVGAVACFLPGGEVRALRHSVGQALGSAPDRRIEFAVRAPVLSLARLGLRFADVPPEARTALASIRGVEVGIYETHGARSREDRARLLPLAESAMNRRGWDRVVGVLDGEAVVAVFMPRQGSSPHDLRLAVMVFNPEQTVVATVRGDAFPLANLGFAKLHEHLPFPLRIAAATR